MRIDEEHIPRKVWRPDIPRKNEGRTSGNKMERRVPTGHGKYWTESGRGDGLGVGRSSVIPATLYDGKSQGTGK